MISMKIRGIKNKGADRPRCLVIMVMMVLTTLFPVVSEADDGIAYERTSSEKGVDVSTDVVALALPAATLAGVLIERDWHGLAQCSYTAALTAGVTLLLKYTVREKRPDGSNMHSFPSGHTAVTFASAAFVQRRYGWKFGVPAYALAAYTGWGRVYSKKHHWWDVVAGAAIGAGSAYLFTRQWAAEHQLEISAAALTDPVTLKPSFGFSASFVL